MKNFIERALIAARALRAIYFGEQQDPETREVLKQGEEQLKQSGIDDTSYGPRSIALPHSRGLMTVANSGLVATSVPYEAMPEASESVLNPLATVISEGRENITLPSLNTFTAFSTAENAEIADGASVSDISFTPFGIALRMAIARNVFIGGAKSESALVYLLQRAFEAIHDKKDSLILGAQEGSAAVFQGLGFALSSGSLSKSSIVPKWSDILAMENEIGAAKLLKGNLAYITTPKGLAVLKSQPDVFGSRMLLENNKLNGYPIIVVNGASDAVGTGADGSILAFGNWKTLCIREFGAMVVTLDPFSQAVAGKVILTFQMWVDAKSLRTPVSIGGLKVNNYDGFSLRSIKVS